MNSHIKPFLVAVLAAVLILTGLCGNSLAGDVWPEPMDGWWKKLSPGDSAIFEMKAGPHNVKTTVSILKVEGSKITFSNQAVVAGNEIPAQTNTLDVNSKEANLTVPSDATVRKIGNQTFKAGDKTFKCTEYEVTVKGQTSNVCYSSQLPVIYSGGNVWMKSNAGGQATSMTLIEYKGTMLGK